MNKYQIRKVIQSINLRLGKPKLFDSLSRNLFISASDNIKNNRIILDWVTSLKLKLWFFADSDIGFNGLYLNGNFEAEETNLIKQTLEVGDIVIDIGANIGLHSIIAAKSVGPQGKVFAIEPYLPNLSVLRKNLFENYIDNVVVIPLAAGKENGTNKYYIYEDFAYNSLQNTNRVKLLKSEKIKILTIDTLVDKMNINRIDLIKIDIEGHEPEAIQGASKSIHKFRPNILCEIQNVNFQSKTQTVSDVINYICAMGYRGYQITPTGLISIHPKNHNKYRNFYFKPT